MGPKMIRGRVKDRNCVNGGAVECEWGGLVIEERRRIGLDRLAGHSQNVQRGAKEWDIPITDLGEDWMSQELLGSTNVVMEMFQSMGSNSPSQVPDQHDLLKRVKSLMKC